MLMQDRKGQRSSSHRSSSKLLKNYTPAGADCGRVRYIILGGFVMERANIPLVSV